MEITVNQAIVAHQEGRLEEAERLYRSILENQPTNLDVNNNLGVLLYSLGKFDEAEASYRKAIEIKPDYLQAHNNLGVVLQSLSRHDDADASYGKVIKLNPEYAEVHNNLGILQMSQGKIKESEASYRKAIELKPGFIEAYCNLGSLLSDFNELDEAETNANKAIEINPNYEKALLTRGRILFKKEKFELALRDLECCSSNESRSIILSSLYNLGRTKEIYESIEKNLELDDKDIKVAAFSSFISHKEKKVTAHKFCNNPIDFIHVSNLSTHHKNSNIFINQLIEKLKNVETRWEPSLKTTHKGFQSLLNLFEILPKEFEDLRSIIVSELDAYHSKFKDETCTFIQKWPNEKHLTAWHVILKQQGFQAPHIHPDGWLSGVIYLKVVPHLEKHEGAIEFSLNGWGYSDSNSLKMVKQPNEGDIILFPSSLHHRTIPFSSNKDRISIAFDLIPNMN